MLRTDKLSKVKGFKHPAASVRQKYQRGIALLEALIAMLIFSFGILGIVGLQGVMIKGTTEAKNRADASFIAQRRIAMMWANPANLATFVEVNTVVPELSDGLRTTALINAATRQWRVTVRWTVPGELQHTYSADAYIVGAI